ncbi:unnamed protein product [Urochloa humidicola]
MSHAAMASEPRVGVDNARCISSSSFSGPHPPSSRPPPPPPKLEAASTSFTSGARPRSTTASAPPPPPPREGSAGELRAGRCARPSPALARLHRELRRGSTAPRRRLLRRAPPRAPRAGLPAPGSAPGPPREEREPAESSRLCSRSARGPPPPSRAPLHLHARRSGGEEGEGGATGGARRRAAWRPRGRAACTSSSAGGDARAAGVGRRAAGAGREG